MAFARGRNIGDGAVAGVRLAHLARKRYRLAASGRRGATGRKAFGDIPMDYRPVARRRAAVGAGPPAQSAISDFSRRRRHAAGLRALGPVLDAGARSGAGAVRGAGAAGCRLRHFAARPPEELAAGLDPGIHRGRDHHRRGRGAGARAVAGHAMGRRHRARRHRGAAGCGGGDGDPAPGQAALSHPQNSRRRKPAQRRQRAADLPRRGRRRRGPAFQVERVCALDRAGAGGKPGGRLSVRPAFRCG